MAVKQTRPSLAGLWEQAFANYNQTVEKEGTKRNLRLRLDEFKVGGLVQSIDEVKNAVDESSKAFQKYRHSGSTVDKVREFIGGSLSFVSVVGDNVVESASAAFPPAGAIWTVTTFAIKACQAQSEDYNQLLALIGETGNFLKTIKIIEATVPDCKGYTEFVTEALTAIIGVFAVQTKLMLMKRPLVFLHTLVRGGGDSDLAAAYARVTEALNRLSRANEMMTIKNTEDIKNLVAQLGGRIDFYHENIMAKLADQARGIEMSHQAILVNQVGIEANQQGILANHQLLAQMLRIIQSERPEKPKQTKAAKRDKAGASIPINRVKAFFNVDVDPEVMQHDLARSYIPDSAAWLFETQRYQDWLTSDKPFLPFASEDGQGKSHIAYAVLQQLEDKREPDSGTAVAYFCFQREVGTYRSVVNALCSIFIQISEQDRRFRDKLAKEIVESGEAHWTKFTVPMFWSLFRFDKYYREEGNPRLYIILDNVNEATHEIEVLLAKIAKAAQKGSRIKVFLTLSTEAETLMEIVSEPAMQMSPEDRERMKAAVLEARLEAMPRLSRFQPATKRHVTETLLDNKYSVLYISQVLQMLETKGLERPALKALQTMPATLNELYGQTISRCLEGRARENAEAISFVLRWLSVCQRTLSLQELYALLQLQFGHRVFDIEDEISNRCASILEISNVRKTEKHARQLQQTMLEKQLNTRTTDDESSGFNLASKHSSQSPARMARKISTIQPLYSEDDSDFMVHFQSATMARYMKGSEHGWNDKSFRAHLAALTTCVKVLQTPIHATGTATSEDILQNYAANAWSLHLWELHQCEARANCATNADVEAVVETLLELHVNGKAAADSFYKQESNCYTTSSKLGVVDVVRYWFSRYDAGGTSNTALAKSLAQNPEQFFAPFVRWHAEQWVDQVTGDPAQKAFLNAYCAHSATETCEDDKDIDIEDISVGQIVEFLDHLKGGVVPQNYRFFRAVAILWTELEENEDEAWDSISKSLELFKLDQSVPPEHRGIEDFYTLYWAGAAFDELPRAEYNPYWRQAAQIDRPASLEERTITQDILLKLSWQSQRYEQDREQLAHLFEGLANTPDPRGTWLTLYINHLQSQNKHKEVVEAVTRYGSLRLAMSPIFDQEMHTDYQKSAQISGLVDAMLATYRDLISQLEPLKWASPTKVHLASVYRRIVKNELEAKELLYQVLDADGCFDPAEFQENEDILLKTQMELSEIIYNQFLASSVLEEKRALLREMDSLTNRRLGQSSGVDSSFGTYSTSLARMYRKLGPSENFFEVLDADFKECMDKLSDKDPNNDANTLRQLCKVLSCVPSLERDAELALAASFYNIDPTLDEDMPDERMQPFGEDTDSDAFDWDAEIKNEDSEASGSQSDSGDTDECTNEATTATIDAPDIDLECTGCGFDDWKDDWDIRALSLFRCMICTECTLCGSCVKSLDESSPYCGTLHSHVKMPIEGWIGIKDGEIHIENNEPIQCREWLTQLREEKWPRAWEHIHLG